MHIIIYQCYKNLQKKEGNYSTEHVRLVQSVEPFKFCENPILNPTKLNQNLDRINTLLRAAQHQTEIAFDAKAIGKE